MAPKATKPSKKPSAKTKKLQLVETSSFPIGKEEVSQRIGYLYGVSGGSKNHRYPFWLLNHVWGYAFAR